MIMRFAVASFCARWVCHALGDIEAIKNNEKRSAYTEVG